MYLTVAIFIMSVIPENTCTLVAAVLGFGFCISSHLLHFSVLDILPNFSLLTLMLMLYVVDTNIPLKRSSQHFKTAPCT